MPAHGKDGCAPATRSSGNIWRVGCRSISTAFSTSPPPYYRRWAEILRQALLAEAAALGSALALPLHLRQSAPLADPRDEGGEAFLESLLAPVRGGLILVRDDLRAAAAELALGGRIAERKFVLKALLSQEPRTTLGWLATLAEQSVSRYRQSEPTWGPVTVFWADRAAATAGLLTELRDAA